MSTPRDPAGQPAPARGGKPPSAAARYFFMFLFGLVVGVIAVVMLMRTLEARRTWQDNYPEATMQLLQARTAQLAEARQANRCAPTDSLAHLSALRSLGNDLEPAFPDLAGEPRFREAAANYRRVLDAAIAQPPMDCAALGTTMERIGEDGCKACHRDFRG
jgi:hypothetical protein